MHVAFVLFVYLLLKTFNYFCQHTCFPKLKKKNHKLEFLIGDLFTPRI